jgi:hypothetical protein
MNRIPNPLPPIHDPIGLLIPSIPRAVMMLPEEVQISFSIIFGIMLAVWLLKSLRRHEEPHERQ